MTDQNLGYATAAALRCTQPLPSFATLRRLHAARRCNTLYQWVAYVSLNRKSYYSPAHWHSGDVVLVWCDTTNANEVL